eukprot:11157837-Lingulodinium_polyedra.AAC.1
MAVAAGSLALVWQQRSSRLMAFARQAKRLRTLPAAELQDRFNRLADAWDSQVALRRGDKADRPGQH